MKDEFDNNHHIVDFFKKCGDFIIDKIIVFFDWIFDNWIEIITTIVMLSILGIMVFGMVKCTSADIKREKQEEIDRTTGDSTFINIIDGEYIYKREIEGHEFYMYMHKDQYGHLTDKKFVHSPNCWCNTCEKVEL
jgi:hypothetical protein